MQAIFDRFAGWFMGGAAPAPDEDVHPYFAEIWRALERALADNRVRIAPGAPPAFHKFVEVRVHPDDMANWIAPFKQDLDAALEREHKRMLERLRYPGNAAVKVYFTPANLVFEVIRVGTVSAVARATMPDPGLLRAGQLVTDLGAPPTEPGVGPSHAAAAMPEVPLARLSWREPSGEREATMRELGVFGREEDADVVVRSAQLGDDIHIVGREALSFERCPVTRHAIVQNRRPVELAIETAGSAEVARLAPLARHTLPKDARIVWPGQTGGRGFVLNVRTERIAVATLASAKSVQRVLLQAPGCEVVGDPRQLGVEGVRFSVDFGGGELRVRNLGTATSRIGDGDESRELMPADGQVMRFGPVRVQIHKELR